MYVGDIDQGADEACQTGLRTPFETSRIDGGSSRGGHCG